VADSVERTHLRRLTGYLMAVALPLGLAVALEDTVVAGGSSGGSQLLTVALAGVAGGLGPGLLAAVMALLCQWYFFLTPARSFELESTEEVVILAIFAACALLIALIIHLLDLARETASREADSTRRLLGFTGSLARLGPGDELEVACAEHAVEATGAAWVEVRSGTDDDVIVGRDGRAERDGDVVVSFEGVISVAGLATRPCRYRFGYEHAVGHHARALVEAITNQCSATLERLLYRRAEQIAEGEQVIVAKAATELAEAPDTAAVTEVLCKLAVPDLGDTCEILLRDAGGAAQPASTTPGVPELRLPLVADGRVVGDMVLVRRDGFDAVRRGLAQRVAEIAARALDRALVFEVQQSTSMTLQRSLLPPALLSVPGIDVAATYIAVGDFEVGGDFYDGIRHAGGAMTLIIGDVQGKGIDAATLNALARQTLRALAMRGARPAEMLAALNDALLYSQEEQAGAGDDDPMRLVTAAVVHLAPADDGFVATVSCGGHPPPIIVRADGTPERAEAFGTVLGLLPDPTLREMRTHLALADTLVLYTDGVTDVHNGHDFLGEDDLARLIRNRLDLSSASDVVRHVTSTVQSVAERELRDDIAMVVARVTHRTADGPAG
jgi:serine phosphatase RsbU (regulator of sigma subunit)